MNPLASTTDTLNQIALILGVLTALVVVVLVIVVWSKWQSLSGAPRLLVFLAIGLAALLVALSAGFVAKGQLEQLGIPTDWDGLTARATDIWRYFDGWTRSHRWVGVVLLALTPALLWPRDSEETTR